MYPFLNAACWSVKLQQLVVTSALEETDLKTANLTIVF